MIRNTLFDIEVYNIDNELSGLYKMKSKYILNECKKYILIHDKVELFDDDFRFK